MAVLLDHAKRPCADIRGPEKSRIFDDEMTRINIEASAALAQWIDLIRGDWQRYLALVQARRRLSMPQKRVTHVGPDPCPWPEQVLPYAYAAELLITPTA